MAYVASFKCECGFVFDIHNSPRVSKTKANSKYYITPLGIKEIQVYMAENEFEDKIKDMKDIEIFIEKGWIKPY